MLSSSATTRKKVKLSSRWKPATVTKESVAANFKNPDHVIVRAPGRKSSSSLSSGAKNCSTPGVHSPVSVREPAATPGVVLTASMQSPVTKPTTTYNHRGVPWRRMRSTKT